MRLSPTQLDQLAEHAVEAARCAGAMIAKSRPEKVEAKAGGDSPASQIVTEVDRRSEEIIVDVLHPTIDRYELALLTEERDDDGGRLRADHFWCIDPLDGTLPFVEGTPGYAVSIALVDRRGTPRIGVVHDPVENVTLHAVSGGGLFRDGVPWHPPDSSESEWLSLHTDRSFDRLADRDALVEGLERIAAERGLRGVRIDATAGAVLNACRVLSEAPACYFKFPKTAGGGSLWDFASTACLFAEAGAVATDIHGDPLDLNRADSTFMNHHGVLFATDQPLAAAIRGLR